MNARSALLVPLLLWMNICTAQTAPCLESNTYDADRIVFVSPSSWYANVGPRLFVFRGDALVTTLRHGEPYLTLACGVDGHVLAYASKNKIFRFDGDSLKPISIDFPGELSHTDGEVTYSSVDEEKNRYAVYATQSGKTTLLEGEALDAGLASNGYFYVSKQGGYSVYRSGKLVASVSNPIDLIHLGVGYSDYGRCGSDGLFFGRTEDTYYLKSAQGLTPVTITDGILKVDFVKGCKEHVVLRDMAEAPHHRLWALKPGEKAIWTQIPTRCEPDSFALNHDGSLYYRCASNFYFMSAARKQSRALGKLAALVDQSGRDQWLTTEHYGALFMHVARQSDATPKACFVRLTPKRMIPAGCVAPDTSQAIPLK